jgi:ArsR family transcriptional regulator, lead/cadmium/zinc/bismuth-responsive transcriptional repressor
VLAGTIRYIEHMSRRSYDAAADVTESCDVFFADPEKVARVRSHLMAAPEVGSLAETFRTLGDPTRVRILDALAAAELCVCDLATLLGLSESAVSHQLRLLRTMRIVRARREGRMVYYALDDHHVTALFEQGLEHVEEARAAGRLPAATEPVGVPE